eukprot:scaffold68958_cov21-Tisochrysis_lutea.AAC.1
MITNNFFQGLARVSGGWRQHALTLHTCQEAAVVAQGEGQGQGQEQGEGRELLGLLRFRGEEWDEQRPKANAPDAKTHRFTNFEFFGGNHKLVQAFENDPHMAAKAQGVVANVETMLTSMRAKLEDLTSQ